MTLSWAPGFCDLGGKETSSPECAEGSGDGFVVHGLWPNNEYRPNPESCLGHDATPDDLDDEHGVYPNDRLAAYEYRKHGTCTGLSPHDYFATVRSVRARLKIPEMFQAPSEQLQMAPEEIEQAFMTANANLHPDNMAISCSNGELVDVRFCLAKDLSSYAVCRKVARHTCQRAIDRGCSGALNIGPSRTRCRCEAGQRAVDGLRQRARSPPTLVKESLRSLFGIVSGVL